MSASIYVDDMMYHKVEIGNRNFKFFWNKAEQSWICIVERIGEYYNLNVPLDLSYFFKDEVE